MNIGNIIIAKDEEEIVWSVLGSCISVIFHIPGFISMLCHAQMPYRDDFQNKCFNSCPNPCFDELSKSLDNKYVKCSVEFMINQLKINKLNTANLNTSLLGGASVIPDSSDISIGEQNINTAKEILKKNKIRIDRELTGGKNGYTFWYYTKSDRLFVKKHTTEKRVELFNN